MARVDLRAPRKTALPIFKKYHRPHQKTVYNAVERRNQATIFDPLALTSFHAFSLSLRRGYKTNAQTVEQDRCKVRHQDRRWLQQVLMMNRNDPMYPSKQERQAFIALTKLPTDEEMYTALTEDKVLGKVKEMYARLLRERDRARKEQGIKHYREHVHDWWVTHRAKMTTMEPKTMEAKNMTHKERIKAQQAEIKAQKAEIKAKVEKLRREMVKMKAKGERTGKVVAGQRVTKDHDKVDWEKLGGERSEEKGKDQQIFALDMPFRGPSI